MSYQGSVELISGIKTKNNGTFPLVDAADVYVDDSTRLSTKLTTLAPLISPALDGVPTAPTAAADTNNTQVATTAFVMNAFQANDAMVLKGTIGTGGTVTTLPDTHYTGWTYRVVTDGTYAGQTCEVGDLIICVADGTVAANADWTVVQRNIVDAVTGPETALSGNVAVFGTNNHVIRDSGYYIKASVPSNAKFTDTTYESKAADRFGEDVSLVTTGEKYIWNNTISCTKGNIDEQLGVTAIIGANKFYCQDGVWRVPAGTGSITEVNTGAGLTGGPITVSGTISLDTSGATAGNYGPSADVTGTNNATISVPYITVDTYGRITNIANKTYTSKDTTYSVATTSANGLMSSADKTKLDGIGVISNAQIDALFQ